MWLAREDDGDLAIHLTKPVHNTFSDGIIELRSGYPFINYDEYATMIAAPTLYEAHKWLRVKYSLYVEVLVLDRNVWKTVVTSFTDKGIKQPIYNENEYNSYEAALNAGIMKALKLI